MKYSTYPEYKDSGVEWLGEVPDHWKHTRLKFIATIQMGQSPVSDDCNVEGIGKPFLQGNAEFGKHFPTPKQYCDTSRKIANEGDILYSVRAPVGAINFADQKYGIGRGLCSIHENRDLDNKFIWWTLIVGRNEFEAVATGSTYEAVSAEQVGNLTVLKPESSEQTQIAKFLDRETTKIDDLISKQQKLIELLKEKRQAVISHAVTKGINPDVKMKDSGVEWLGMVPEHWEVKRFGYVSVVVRGGSPRPAGDPELFHGDHSPWVTVAEITKNSNLYLNSTETYLTKKGSDQCRIFKAGTLLLSNSGATLGVPKILTMNANANDGVVGFEHLNKNINIEFAYFYLSSLTENLRDRIKQGAGQPNLNTDIVKELKVCIPPLDEQNNIVLFIHESLNKIDIARNASEELIKLLQERRTALISAAVTGKIDVRNAQ